MQVVIFLLIQLLKCKKYQHLLKVNCGFEGVDSEFEPTEEADDEETIDVEEAQEPSASREKELELLRQESEIPLEKLLEDLPPEMLEERSDESGSEDSEDSSAEDESEASR